MFLWSYHQWSPSQLLLGQRPSVLNKCQQSPRQFNWSPRQSPIQRNPVLFLKNLSPLNSTLGLLPLDVMPNITLVLQPIPSILFPSLIQIKLSYCQHPCNNLLTDVLLWANYHSTDDGIALPVSGYVIISQSLISILVTIKQLSIVIVPVLFSSTTSTNSKSTSTIYQTYHFW